MSEIGERIAAQGRQFIQSRRTGARRFHQPCRDELPALVIAAMPDVTEGRIKRRIQYGLHAAFELVHLVTDPRQLRRRGLCPGAARPYVHK